MIHGASDKINLYPQEMPGDIELITATDNGSAGYHGPITDLIPDYVNKADGIFACGPEAMYRVMAKTPELKGKRVEVSLETRMGCGRGICYSCTVRTNRGVKQACEDGPTFNLDEIIWDELTNC